MIEIAVAKCVWITQQLLRAESRGAATNTESRGKSTKSRGQFTENRGTPYTIAEAHVEKTPLYYFLSVMFFNPLGYS